MRGRIKSTRRKPAEVKDVFVLRSDGYFWAFEMLPWLNIG